MKKNNLKNTLKKSSSIVIDVGNAYQFWKGKP